MLKQNKRFLIMDDVVPIIPTPIETNEQLLVVLFIIPLLILIFMLLFFMFNPNNGIFTQTNIILIVLSVILIIGYILSRRYLKNRK